MAEKLKREFIELLERDIEFRYTVAGYLGLSEILKRLDRLEENQNKIWEEIRGLREETRSLREGQDKLWENQNRLWEEIRGLREEQTRLSEEQVKLREEQTKIWEEIKNLREGQNRFAAEQERMRKYMISGFRELGRALGVTFEEHAASFLEVMLVEMGHPEAKIERKHILYEGEVIEVNLFCEEPLVVGEATVSMRSAEEAKREVEKLIKRIKVVEERYGKKPTLTVLSVARTTPEATETLKSLTEEYGIKLILGREIEENLQA